MITHPARYLEQLEPAQVDLTWEAALRILEKRGLHIQHEHACTLLAEAGAQVNFKSQVVRFTPELIYKALTGTPQGFTLHARNPAHTIKIGGNTLALCPGYGSPFVSETGRERTPATLADFELFAALAARSPLIDVTGGLLVEPTDVPPALRPLEITYALLARSDKPLMGSVAGAKGAQHSLDMVRMSLGSLSNPAVIGLVNINSPLRLDTPMAEALLAYAAENQPILLTPGILMGMTAPVTVAGALSQAFAELLGCLALIQAAQPGCPVILGLGGFGADLRAAGSGFGRPENALAAVLGAQMARKLKVPFRCSAGVTGAFTNDPRSGYESMHTAFAAWAGGSHFALQAAGTLDCINAMSYEKFVIDLEIWAYIQRLSSRPQFEETDLAIELINSNDGDYMSTDHTVRSMRKNLFTPSLAAATTYDTWWAEGAKDTLFNAGMVVEKVLARPGPLPLDPRLERELADYIRLNQKP